MMGAKLRLGVYLQMMWNNADKQFPQAYAIDKNSGS